MPSKAPVTPSCVGMELFNFPERREIARNPDIFREKGLSHRPYSDHGIATKLAWRSFVFLRSSCWRISELSLRFHFAFTALTMHALCFHSEDAVTSQRTPYNLLANATDN